MADMYGGGGESGGGVNKGSNMPDCTKKYHPTTGGYEGGSFESAGDPGEKEAAGGAPPNAPSDDGNHEMPYLQHGNYPHGTATPDNFVGTLGETPADPTRPMNSKG